ncbi:MAG TPA: tetratricopeptide repeat protein [Vicinamibacteria bacterium]|nr:tetratricopeptide repeat protein [Vicinamibacteria bacterium]
MATPQSRTGRGIKPRVGAGRKAMKRCPSCGAKNKASFEYCVRCAEPLDETAPDSAFSQGRALQAKLFTAAVLAIGGLVLFILIRGVVESVSPPQPAGQTARRPTPPPHVPSIEPLPQIETKEVLSELSEAVAAFNEGDYRTAVAVLQGVVRELPENPTVHQYLGLSYYQMGRYEDAMRSLEEARALRPSSFELLDHYVTAAKKSGDVRAGVEALTEFVNSYPEELEARLELSRLARVVGDNETALAQADYLRKSRNGDPEFAYEYGVSLKEAGRLDEARDALKASIQLDPNSAVAQHALGVTELLSGRPGEAVAPLEAAVAVEPTNGDFRFSLAQAYEKADRVSESLDAYQAYLEHASPNDPRAAVVRERLAIARRALANTSRVDRTSGPGRRMEPEQIL